MRCSNCSREMQPLFISYVCDYCDPPKGQPKPMDWRGELREIVRQVQEGTVPAGTVWRQWRALSPRTCDLHTQCGMIFSKAVWKRVGGPAQYNYSGYVYTLEYLCDQCHKMHVYPGGWLDK